MSLAELQASQQPPHIAKAIEQFQAIQLTLQEQRPGLAMELVELHKNMIEHEEIVHLMGDDEIRTLHLAHESHKQVVAVQVTGKATKKALDTKIKNLKPGEL